MRYQAIKYKTCDDWKTNGCYGIGYDVYGSTYTDINLIFARVENYNTGFSSCGHCRVEVKEKSQ